MGARCRQLLKNGMKWIEVFSHASQNPYLKLKFFIFLWPASSCCMMKKTSEDEEEERRVLRWAKTLENSMLSE